jgi:hypothetical protein
VARLLDSIATNPEGAKRPKGRLLGTGVAATSSARLSAFDVMHMWGLYVLPSYSDVSGSRADREGAAEIAGANAVSETRRLPLRAPPLPFLPAIASRGPEDGLATLVCLQAL